MLQQYESTPETNPPITNARIFDYPTLVEAVQLSLARLLDIEGAHSATSFTEAVIDKSADERERIICEIGSRFDDELINFVTTSLVAQRHRYVVILADTSEGINGTLPWQPKLEQHLRTLHDQNILRNARVDVERYSSKDLESLTQQAQALALETSPSL